MDQILKYADDAIKRGANILLGGPTAKPGNGYFIEPIILEGVNTTDPVWREEIFGPVVVLVKAKDFEDALSLANDSDFKLSGAIHTNDPKRAEVFVNRYNSGVVRVNGPTHGSEPHMPFGGVGMSGNGWREPGSKALDFYADWKQISIDS
jgi:aldehyde dehydrogenase (NAD+)